MGVNTFSFTVAAVSVAGGSLMAYKAIGAQQAIAQTTEPEKQRALRYARNADAAFAVLLLASALVIAKG